MGRVRALLSTTLLSTAVYRAPGVTLLGIGVLFLAGSAAATWSAWSYTGAEIFKAAPGYAIDQLLAASSGVMVTVIKSLLPFFFGFIWDHHVPTALIVLVTWLCCLGACWLTVVVAALEIPTIATLPTRSIAFLAIIWLAVEILAGLLPTVGSAISSAGRDALVRNRSFIAANAPNQPSNTPSAYGDLMDLLERASVRSRASTDIDGVELSPDGSIRTTQSALARCLKQSKSTVNGRLRSLQAEGRIELRTTPNCTLIRLIRSDAAGPQGRAPVDGGCPTNDLKRAQEPEQNAQNAPKFSKFPRMYAFLQRTLSMIGASRTPRPG
jgi:hypothetical protein